MAAPSFLAAGTLFEAASGTNITPVIPGGTQANDVAVAAYMCNVGSTFTTPTGWTVLGTSVNSANQSTAWFWKRLVGGDANPSSTTSATGSTSVGLYGRVYVFRGAITTGNPFESVGNDGVPTNSATPQSSSVTTAAEERLACSLVLVDDDNVWNSGMPPTNWLNTGGRLATATGGDAMSDAIRREAPNAVTFPSVVLGTMSAADFWRTLSFALIPPPPPQPPVEGVAVSNLGFSGTAQGTRVPSTQAPPTRAPIPAVLMVESASAWDVHPYYKQTVAVTGWGNATDLAAIDAAVANWPNRTRVVLIAEDSDTSLGRCTAALNWALRHYDEVQSIHLRTPIIDLVERHDRVAGDATSIETAHGGTGQRLRVTGATNSRAWTADKAALRLTGTVDIRIGLRNLNWLAQRTLVGRYRTTDNQRSYWLRTTAAGMLEWLWSTAGTSSTIIVSANHTSLDQLIGDDGIALRVVFKPVDGGNHSVRFETSTYVPGTWTQLGDLRSFSGNTSIHPGTANLEVGSINDGALNLLDAYVGWVEVRDGEDGTIVADPDFSTQSVGATSFVEGSNTWNVVSPASITPGYLAYMGEWSPGFAHRRGMCAQLFGPRMHIWRDPADTVTPAATTDAIATDMRATLHTTLGTPAEIVPESQDWVQQSAWQHMKRIHDYARTSTANVGYKTGDGARTVELPDGRWVTIFADTSIGTVDPDDSIGTGGSIVRNSMMVHDGNGNVTGQKFHTGSSGPAMIPDQVTYPSSFCWPVGACMDNNLLNVLVQIREEDGFFGVFLDMGLMRFDPSTLALSSFVSLGEPAIDGMQNAVPDPATGFIYIVMWGPNSVGRVPIGQLGDIAQWRYWDGTGWSTDRSARAAILEDVDGQTRPLRNNTANDSIDIRRWGTTWILCCKGWFRDYIGIYYSLTGLPQGPYRHYENAPTPECGGIRYASDVYDYTPFWHPERDPAPDRLMLSYNSFIFGSGPPGGSDFLFGCPHFLVVPIYRDVL